MSVLSGLRHLDERMLPVGAEPADVRVRVWVASIMWVIPPAVVVMVSLHRTPALVAQGFLVTALAFFHVGYWFAEWRRRRG